MKITWYGHSTFRIEIPAANDKGKVEILLDPFLNGNPKAPVTIDQAAEGPTTSSSATATTTTSAISCRSRAPPARP